jgi:leucyl aminopeptidase (aminopeptidase T)
MSELDQAVRAVVRDCLGVSEGEEVLVVCNPATAELGERMRAEAGEAGADAVLATIAERASHAAEPPRTVAEAMKAADVVLAPTVQSLSHTASRKAASEAGARIATLPGVTEEMLARVMSADMAELRRRGAAVAKALDDGSEARVTCPNGSDVRVSLEGRTAIPDAGELTATGAFGNLPCGEGFIAPAHTEGRLVIDGSIAGVGLVDSPVELTVEADHLVRAAGEQTNEKAILTGNVLEDEKILGTCHVAFGASAAIGGNIQVPVHLDCVVMKPTVEIDGEPLVRTGELLV